MYQQGNNNKSIVVLDTSIATYNVGDEVIMDAVNNELFTLFSDNRFIRLPTHEVIHKTGLSYIRRSDFTFLGGSNILSSNMLKYKQWKIMMWQALFIKEKITLLGVGWRNYQSAPNFYTRVLLKKILSRDTTHSVRDSYTLNFLQELGFTNVINTSCPTMWNLTAEHCKQIPENKAETVVFTLTDYDKDTRNDTFLIDILLNNYQYIYFWVQGKNDYHYLHSLVGEKDLERIKIIPPNLKAYDSFLQQNICDYVGTRLHGGIRALQNKKRTIIIGIDNRALEKKKDFNMTVIERNELALLQDLINGAIKTIISIPIEAIESWKSQFK